MVDSLIVLIEQLGDQLFMEDGGMLHATYTVGRRVDNVRPFEGHPLTTPTLDHDGLGVPPIDPAELHLLNVVVLGYALEDPHLVSFPPLCGGAPFVKHLTLAWALLGFNALILVVNTETHRQKFLNVERDSKVTLTIRDEENPYRYTEVRGEVVQKVTGQEARDHIDELSQKYHGEDYSPDVIVSERVMLWIVPSRQNIVDQTVSSID